MLLAVYLGIKEWLVETMIKHSVEGEVACLESYPDRCLQGLTKTTNNLKIDNILVEIKSGYLLNKRPLPMFG